MRECARLSACCGRGVVAAGVGWLCHYNVPKESNERSPALLYRFSGRCAFPIAHYTSGVFVVETLSVSFLGVRAARGHLKVQSVM